MLDPNGSCLGVALLQCWEWVGANPPTTDLVSVATVKEAVDMLSLNRRPRVVIRSGASGLERLALRFGAWRLGLSAVDASNIRSGVVLCLRSMSQLYGLPRSEGHWIAAQIDAHGIFIADELEKYVRNQHPESRPSKHADLLAQVGPTLVL